MTPVGLGGIGMGHPSSAYSSNSTGLTPGYEGMSLMHHPAGHPTSGVLEFYTPLSLWQLTRDKCHVISISPSPPPPPRYPV